MRPVLCLFLWLLCWLAHAAANVEKVIFLGPQPSAGASARLLRDPLVSSRLQSLSPANSSLRRRLHAAFPHSPPSPSEPSEAWILLEQLTPGQRYEVRVCWSATEPTNFNMSVHELSAVLDSPTLDLSLRRYLDGPSGSSTISEPHKSERDGDGKTALLFHISAAADYFTDDRDLMSNGLLMTVDIILDPFLLNVFPASLLPTGLYIAALAVVAWFFSSAIANSLQELAGSNAVLSTKKTS